MSAKKRGDKKGTRAAAGELELQAAATANGELEGINGGLAINSRE